tara:strand:- start:3613 stop:4950 length:1338 start_codon:yes stop_codon:yes gene_type:complete
MAKLIKAFDDKIIPTSPTIPTDPTIPVSPTISSGGPTITPEILITPALPTIAPDAPPVEDTPQVRCIDGSYAASLEECPQATTDEYDPDIGWNPDPEGNQGDFITGFGEHEDSALIDVYEAIGGESWTNLSFEQWKELYGDDFPTWDESIYKKQTENIEAGMSLLGEQLDLTKKSAELSAESLRFTTGAALEDTTASREAAVRAGGGIYSGAMEKKFDNAYDRILEGFDFEAESQEIALSQSLIDIEGRRLDYGMDLLNVVENYQDTMWDLIVASKPLQKADGWTPPDNEKFWDWGITDEEGNVIPSEDEKICPGVSCGPGTVLNTLNCQCDDTPFDDYDEVGTSTDCVIATHAVGAGVFTRKQRQGAVRWCVQNLHNTWYGESLRRGYRSYGNDKIAKGKAENYYEEFQNYIDFATGKKRNLKNGWIFVKRSIHFFLKGLFIKD